MIDIDGHRQYSASRQALRFAAHAVLAGVCDLVVATGVEPSWTRPRSPSVEVEARGGNWFRPILGRGTAHVGATRVNPPDTAAPQSTISSG
ncbi:hypothetical protein [Nocardia sp. NPDC004123]